MYLLDAIHISLDGEHRIKIRCEVKIITVTQTDKEKYREISFSIHDLNYNVSGIRCMIINEIRYEFSPGNLECCLLLLVE